MLLVNIFEIPRVWVQRSMVGNIQNGALCRVWWHGLDF